MFFKHTKERKGGSINAFLDYEKLGYLRYELPDLQLKTAELAMLNVKDQFQRRGIGTALIEEFRDEIDEYNLQHIYGLIIHDPSLDVLSTINPNADCEKSSIVNFVEPGLLSTIPLVRVLERGGLRVESIDVKYKPNRQDGHNLFLVRSATFNAIPVR